jgi:hypothetical protein
MGCTSRCRDAQRREAGSPNRSKEDAVTLIQPRTEDLATKHSELVAEHHSLERARLAHGNISQL